MIEQYEAGAPELAAPRPYALTLAHKHLPEMVAHTGIAASAGVHADRRQFLQGAVGVGAAAPDAVAGGKHRRHASKILRSTTLASASSG